MKRYKVTVTFEVNDNTGEIEQEIQEKGITHVEKVFALGFTDPELEGVTSKVEEVEKKLIHAIHLESPVKMIIEFKTRAEMLTELSAIQLMYGNIVYTLRESMK